MLTDFYGISCNPFSKDSVREKDAFLSRDHEQMLQRLDYLKTYGSVGVFTAPPGMGKTFALRCHFKNLQPSLNKTAYIPLTTVPVTEFYAQICTELGLERSARKSTMFKAIRECIYSLYKDKHQPLLLAIDEAQYLAPSILFDLKMLLNYEYDSKNCFSLILLGEPQLNHILQKPVHEALRQRILVNYDFKGLSDDEVTSYLTHKLDKAGGTIAIIDSAAIRAVTRISQGNPRKIDILMTHALTFGAQAGKHTIDSELIKMASDNIALK